MDVGGQWTVYSPTTSIFVQLRPPTSIVHYYTSQQKRHKMSKLIFKHGGYQRLKSFQLARLIYDITLRFCDKFIKPQSRTHDQMVQAARSGVQNIAEGSQASGTSKKTEIKLTNVARASLEELRLDYEDFIRQRLLRIWSIDDPLKQEIHNQRFDTADDFALWVQNMTFKYNHPVSELAANGVLYLLKITCRLLDRQLQSQADAFELEGGFTERLYQYRKFHN